MRLAPFAALLLPILAAGCAETAPTFLANGQEVIRVTCNYTVQGATACFSKAGAICGDRGYVLFDWSGQPWTRPYPDPDVLQGDPAFSSTGLLVACQRPPGPGNPA